MIKNRIKTFAIIIGAILEYYDYMLFSAMAPILKVLYFPSESVVVGYIKTYCIGFFGTFGRPLGGYLFGTIGDKHSRPTALCLSIFLMAIATFGMAILPNYGTLGIWAPFFLFILRFFQSMSAGGETPGVGVYMVESEPVGRKNLGSAYAVVCMLVGTLGALLSAFWVKNSANPNVFWRYPFFGGVVIAFTGLAMRYALLSSTRQQDISEKDVSVEDKINAQYINKKLIKPMIYTILLSGVFVGLLYFSVYFVHDYMVMLGYIDITTSFFLRILSLISLCVFVIIFGKISDHLDNKKCMMLGLFLTAVNVLVLLSLVQNIYHIILFNTVLGCGVAAYVAPMHCVLHNFFPKKNRFKAVAFLYSLGSWLLGSSTSTICSLLYKTVHTVWAPSIWIIFLCVMGIGTLIHASFFWVSGIAPSLEHEMS